MPTSSTPLVDWQAIQPHGGSKRSSFEELCCQLAREEHSEGEFFRKGTPDAGNECYRKFSNGREWGWQAKFVDQLDESLLGQIDQSVKAALKGHPDLVRYHICLPFNLPDGRIEQQRSQRDRWDRRVAKWKVWAAERGMTVQFILWDDSELVSRLSEVKFRGKRQYFFGTAVMDPFWFNVRLEEAIANVGVRYTPALHQELQIAQVFEALGRTDDLFNRISSLAPPIKRALDAAAWMTRTDERLRNEESQVNGVEFLEKIDSTFSRVRDIVELLNKKAEDPIAPIPQLPLRQLLPEVIDQLQKIDGELFEWDQLAVFEGSMRQTERQRDQNAFNRRSSAVYAIQEKLTIANDFIIDALELVESTELLIKGDAGLGKTHLLCDVAKGRLERGLPTVLLLGKRFTDGEPWTQALQQLDCRTWDTDEFIGALESAAQSAGHRAMIMVDGLNEGRGRTIWPDHLIAFLHRIHRSPWISAVLTVRSSYIPPLRSTTGVLPAEVLERIVIREHHGFDEMVYDASRSFFEYYGIDYPAASPWLISEFRNPLFLKLLCEGLQAMGYTAMPVGLNGVSQVFSLYLDGINMELSRRLSYSPTDNKVRRAIEALAANMADAFTSRVEFHQAQALVDQIHPSTGVSDSLFHGLVEHSILMVDQEWRSDTDPIEIVHPSYDRLTDHLVAAELLKKHLDLTNPKESFEKAPLSEIVSPRQWRHQGLVEALCIQIPEKIGKELIELAPGIEQNQRFPSAFLQSMYWRRRDTFSETTSELLEHLLNTPQSQYDTLETLLSISMIPDHPHNALSLNDTLLPMSMADRDGLWSIFLHRSWNEQNEARRLVEWASALPVEYAINDTTLELATTTLGWMLTASNRFVRDRATKALVNLLTSRLTALQHFIHRFRDVNDLYVVERVYAIAYGVVMRSRDVNGIRIIAQETFEHVFKSGLPTPHVLLREYARGIVERFVFLGGILQGDLSLIRPPYRSEWPKLITAKQFKNLSKHRNNRSSGYNRIVSSVMHDDFALYIIGTNAGGTHFLSLRLSAPPWQSDKDQLKSLVASFSESQRTAWDSLKVVEDEGKMDLWASVRIILPDGFEDPVPRKQPSDIDRAWWRETEDVEEAARLHLRLSLRPEQWRALQAIREAKERRDSWHPPEFPLDRIQRYILKRVFDLGWNDKAFGQFDGQSELMSFREARKAERMGKKYQWIAYHEFCAYLSDHYQYRDPHSHSPWDRAYQGAWQLRLKDIDPSHTLQQMPADVGAIDQPVSWWYPCRMQWGLDDADENWVRRTDDLPLFGELLLPEPMHKGKSWVNMDLMRSWHQPTPEGIDPYEVDRRELWLMGQAYLLRSEDALAFTVWARQVNFWNRWMPEPHDRYEIALGEHHWSPAARFYEHDYYGSPGWVTPERGCPVEVIVPSINYLNEKGLDCSLESPVKFAVPSSRLIEMFNLTWSGSGSDFLDEDGNLVAFDPTVNEAGSGALLVDKTFLQKKLQEKGLALCWIALGEKKVRPGRQNGYQKHCITYSGAFQLSEDGVTGFLHGYNEKGRSRNDDGPQPDFTLEYT